MFQPRTMFTESSQALGTEVNDLSSLLVAPDKEYYLYITLSEFRDGRQITYSECNEMHIYLGNEDDEDAPSFEAGNEYLITLTIHGSMDVEVDAELVEWKDAGDIEYDADDAHRPGQKH